MSKLLKRDFLHFVRSGLYQNPDWMEETIAAASQGVLEKLKDNRKVSVDIQYALAMLHDKQYGKLNKESKKSVNKAILECDVFEGTKEELQIYFAAFVKHFLSP